jgi:hypothetical protein
MSRRRPREPDDDHDALMRYNDRIGGLRGSDLPVITWRRNETNGLGGEFRQIELEPRYHDAEDEFSIDLSEFLAVLERPLHAELRHELARLGGLSFLVLVTAIYHSAADEDDIFTRDLSSLDHFVLTYSDLLRAVSTALSNILAHNDQMTADAASGLVLTSVIRVTIRVHRYNPSNRVLPGGRFEHLYRARARGHIKLPSFLANRQTFINVKNRDDRCFLYALEALYHKRAGSIVHRDRPSSYAEHHFDFSECNWPVRPCDLPAFERVNAGLNIAIDVFGLCDESPVVLHRSANRDDDATRYQLLVITRDRDDEQTDFHYVAITDFDAFVGLRTHRHGRARPICRRCFADFDSDVGLNDHLDWCEKRSNEQSTVLPPPSRAQRYFRDHANTVRKPFVVYADFESFNAVLPVDQSAPPSIACRQTRHIAASFATHLVCAADSSLNRTFTRRYESRVMDPVDDSVNESIGREFMAHMRELAGHVQTLIDERFSFEPDLAGDCPQSDDCMVCRLPIENGFDRGWRLSCRRAKEEFASDKDYYAWRRRMKSIDDDDELQADCFEYNRARVPYHDPSIETNNIRGSCHKFCSRVVAHYGRLPVIFHNLSHYDAFHIIKALDSREFEHFSAIPLQGEAFLSFNVDGLAFLDSFKFMSASLDRLVKQKAKGPLDIAFPLFSRWLRSWCSEPDRPAYSEELLRMCCQKGEFPYDWFSHPSKLDDTSLPAIEHWRSVIHQKDCSPADHQTAVSMWDALHCRTFADYHDFYLMQDVLLMSDVFEDFRRICQSEAGLEPFSFVSLPSFCFSKMLRGGPQQVVDGAVRPFEIQIFDNSQRDMYEFAEQSVRGGVSICPGRYAKANHKFLADFDRSQPSKFISYLDANNLYAVAMMRELPIGDYEWIDPGLVRCDGLTAAEAVFKDGEDEAYGYFVEVDGDFPEEKHDYLSDFPVAPERRAVIDTELSPWTQSALASLSTESRKMKHDHRTEKLLCTLTPRTRYKLHYQNLQLYTRLGFRVTHIHRILRFRQSKWLSGYIESNNAKRKAATSDFEKDFYKLCNNSVYGKFLQDNRQFTEVCVVRDSSSRKTHEPTIGTIRDFRIVNENLVLAIQQKPNQMLDSPNLVGSSILEFSKNHMYEFYYDVIKEKFWGSKSRLIFSDTDSLCIEFHSQDLMADFDRHKLLDELDLSDFPDNEDYYGHNYHSDRNKKVVGKFKDEMAHGVGSAYITEVVALKSKMYSCLKSDGGQKAVIKGVKPSVKRDHLRHEVYKSALNIEEFRFEPQDNYGINHSDFCLWTTKKRKVTVSPLDSKVFQVDSMHSLPYGHYKTAQLLSGVNS